MVAASRSKVTIRDPVVGIVHPAPGPHLQHRHPPNQPLPLHPGANRPAAAGAPASCVTSPRRVQAPPLSSPWQPCCCGGGQNWAARSQFPLPEPRWEFQSLSPLPPPRGAGPPKPQCVAQGCLCGGRDLGPSASGDTRSGGSTRRSQLNLSGLIPSSAPLPHSTWGAAEYPIESVKSHSSKGMRGAVWAWVRHLHSGLLLGLGVLGQVQLLSVPVKDCDAVDPSLSCPVCPTCEASFLQLHKRGGGSEDSGDP